MNRIVLIGALPPPVAGQSIAFKMFYDFLLQKKNQIKLINIGGEDSNRKDGGFTIKRVFSFIVPFIKALSLLNLFQKKVVYLHIAQSRMGFLRDLVFIMLSWFGRNNIVLHLHGGNYDNFYYSQSKFFRKLIVYVLDRSDKIIVLSENLKKVFSFSESLNKKIVAVENGIVIPEKFPPFEKELTDSKVRILYLSNMIESKGYLDLLEAAAFLRNKGLTDFQMIFCGKFYLESNSLYNTEDEARESFLKRVCELGLEKNVTWKKQVFGDEKWEELKKAHFFVLPTYYNNEGQPLAVIEALSQGCCVLATDYRAIPDLLDYEKSGVFIDKRNPADIAEKIIALTKDKKRYKDLSENAVRHYQHSYTASIHLEKLFKTVVSE